MDLNRNHSGFRVLHSIKVAGAGDVPARLSRFLNFQLTIIFIFVTAFMAAPAFSQSSSLFGSAENRRPMTLDQYSWTYVKPVEPQPVRLHSLITVLVNEMSVVISEGQMDRKKKAHGALRLSDWILFKGFSIIPDPQSQGEPNIRGEVDNKMRSQANLETRDKMTFKMACEVVDIRPNGVMVLEGHQTIANNDEFWEYTLTGEIETRDILPDNTVRSENIAKLDIKKRERGHVRDGYRRGWMLQWLDKVQPF